MKKVLGSLIVLLIILVGCGSNEEEQDPIDDAIKAEEERLGIEDDQSDAELEEVEEVSTNEPEEGSRSEAELNAEEYPASPGSMLYDKDEEKFKGMDYHFKGELVKVEKVEGLFGEMEDAFLVKNEEGYVMPIFPPYEMEANEGDEIEVWGNLSGDGYSSSDLGVDNVVGVAGAMNASEIHVNGEMQ